MLNPRNFTILVQCAIVALLPALGGAGNADPSGGSAMLIGSLRIVEIIIP